MDGYLKPLLAVAAVVIIAVAGFAVLRQPDDRSGGIVDPTSSSSPSPAASSPPTPIPLPEGTIVTGGTYRLRPSEASRVAIDADIPAGWTGVPPGKLNGPTATSQTGGRWIAFLTADGVFLDPCHWDRYDTHDPGQSGMTVGPTVDDLVDALRTNTSYTTTSPEPVTLGGYHGQRLELRIPSDVNIETCESGIVGGGRFLVFADASGGHPFGQAPGDRWQVSIVDVAGTRLIMVVGDNPATPDADRAAAQSIVDSLAISITP
jgi:hypothetical protein